jgi:4'-phosphopantetheinyl transferase
MNLQREVVEIWILNVTSMRGGDFNRCNSVLSDAEKIRMGRLLFREDRDSYCAPHGLCGMALSCRCPTVPPESWRFQVAQFGRPEIAAVDSGVNLRFNISHTRGMVACIVTSGIDCGVDIEKVRRFTEMEGLAGTILADSEFERFLSAPENERPLIFSRFWTLKESYVKATGYGLKTPLDSVEFDLTRCTPRLMSSFGSWSFTQRVLGEGYVVSAAVQTSTRPSFLLFDGLPVLHSDSLDGQKIDESKKD